MSSLTPDECEGWLSAALGPAKTAAAWADLLREPADAARKLAAMLPLAGETCLYLLPDAPDLLGVLATDIGDFDRVKRAFAPWDVLPLDEAGIAGYPWVKVAHSETLRRAGELLNYFPGQYVDGLPNQASPLAAILTSSMLGAGVGYGAGRLLKKTTPDGYGDNLPRTGALAGAALGAVPGLAYAYANAEAGKSMLEPGITSPLTDATSVLTQGEAHPDLSTGLPQWLMSPAIKGTRLFSVGGKMNSVRDDFVKAAYDFSEFGIPVSRVGQTLWLNGATPGDAASTMGTLYAAQQLPDPNGGPDWVTGRQLGQLALNAVGDYGRGVLAGHAINAIIGTPHPASVFGGAAAVTGLLSSVASSIFNGRGPGG